MEKFKEVVFEHKVHEKVRKRGIDITKWIGLEEKGEAITDENLEWFKKLSKKETRILSLKAVLENESQLATIFALDVIGLFSMLPLMLFVFKNKFGYWKGLPFP